MAVLAVAYGSQAPTLGVAEFAPAANAAVDAPPATAVTDSSSTGAGRGRQRPTTTTTAPPTSATAAPESAAAPTTRVGRARDCVGNPPRQTEDPMSPPCVGTIFEGDNGGSTSAGVTGTEIRIGVPTYSLDTWVTAPVEALFAYANQRFEFYGRRLVPVFVPNPGSTAVDARAHGAQVAAQGVFGAITGAREWNYAPVALPAELARQRIVTVVRGTTAWWSDRTLYDALHPYVWSVYPSAEDLQANLSSFACSSLAGRPAAHAGDALLRAATRKFAIVSFGGQTPIPTGDLQRGLAACAGVTPDRVEYVDATTERRSGLERLRSGGATTFICVCEASKVQTVMSEAHNMGFYPEWLFTPTLSATGNDEHWLQTRRVANQVAPPLRLDAGPRLLPTQARPWYGALQSLLLSPPAGVSFWQAAGLGESVYANLLVLAAGIQGAGPHLTPDTFAQALMSTQFPNAGAGRAPYWQPSAGFGPGDHSFYDDYNVAWWSDTAEALDLGSGLSTRAQGSWCYLDQATRFAPGSYPTDAEARLFNASAGCR